MTSIIEAKEEMPTSDPEEDPVYIKHEPAAPAPDTCADERGGQWGWSHNDVYHN